jgi:hypothetical protein
MNNDNENHHVKKIGTTTDDHRRRHVLLHKHLDELFADYIDQHPEEHNFTQMPLINLINWSFEQTWKPTEKPKQ